MRRPHQLADQPSPTSVELGCQTRVNPGNSESNSKTLQKLDVEYLHDAIRIYRNNRSTLDFVAPKILPLNVHNDHLF